jgi:DNA-binding LacI/PurR family transcriptional regulator
VIETDNPDALGGNNFFIVLADAMQGVMAERGYDLVLLPCRRAANPLDFLRRVVRRGIVDAVVISATRREDPRIEFLLRSGLPFLTLGRSETPGDYAWIDLDFEGVARTSVERLVALGHRRIAVAVPDDDTNLTHIYRSTAARVLAEQGIPPDPALVLSAGARRAGWDRGRAAPPCPARPARRHHDLLGHDRRGGV